MLDVCHTKLKPAHTSTSLLYNTVVVVNSSLLYVPCHCKGDGVRTCMLTWAPSALSKSLLTLDHILLHFCETESIQANNVSNILSDNNIIEGNVNARQRPPTFRISSAKWRTIIIETAWQWLTIWCFSYMNKVNGFLLEEKRDDLKVPTSDSKWHDMVWK